MIGKVGADFTLPDQFGNKFNLYKALKDHKFVLLVFYPKDFTPVCTKQLNSYNNNFQKFSERNILPAAISVDPVESHQKFNFKYDFSFPLLSDTDKSVSKSFNALNFLNRNKRKLVLLNRDKIILFSKTVFPFRFLSYESLLSKIVE